MVGPILGTGARIAGNVGMRILTSEGAILGKAWWGFKARREIVAGIRTGLGLGAGIGSFINDGSNPFTDETRPGTSPYKFNKKYSRQRKFRRHSRRNNYCSLGNRRKRLYRSNRSGSYRR